MAPMLAVKFEETHMVLSFKAFIPSTMNSLHTPGSLKVPGFLQVPVNVPQSHCKCHRAEFAPGSGSANCCKCPAAAAF